MSTFVDGHAASMATPMLESLAWCLAAAAEEATCSGRVKTPGRTGTAPIKSVVHLKKRWALCRSPASIPPLAFVSISELTQCVACQASRIEFPCAKVCAPVR